MFNKFTKTNIIIYSIILVLILFLIKNNVNIAYIIISLFIFSFYIYHNQTISYENLLSDRKTKNKYIDYIGTTNESFLSKDLKLLEILYSARYLKLEAPIHYNELLILMDDFFVTYTTLKKNVNNIYIQKDNIIQPIKLNPATQTILINDLRDQLERILKHMDMFILQISANTRYTISLYYVNQQIKSRLSKYYNEILNKFDMYPTKYEILRSNEDKYDFL
jgi:hypothetical protein